MLLNAVKARLFHGRRKLREILRRSTRLSRRSGRTILAIAGKPVKNVTAYMEAMQKQKRGEEMEITVERKGEKLTLKVTPQ